MNDAALATTEQQPALRTISIPAIGAEWQGGIFTGIVRGNEGAPGYLLILGPEADGALTWNAASAWAKALDTAGYRDWTLPTRREQSLLFANVGDQFQPHWYWSGEQYAHNGAYAWVQSFGYGGQYDYRKDYYYRARAVRRLPIQ